MAQIQPLTFPILGTANDLLLRVLAFDMDAQTASFYYELRDTTSSIVGDIKVITSGNIEMDELEYAAWGADNMYCIEWAANKLGLTLIP